LVLKPYPALIIGIVSNRGLAPNLAQNPYFYFLPECIFEMVSFFKSQLRTLILAVLFRLNQETRKSTRARVASE